MGLLGLVQLEYFARSRPSQAQAALRNSMHPRRYYPFAATGINITSFVLELARNRHLHVHMFKTLEINTMQHRSDAAEGPCSSPALVDIGLSAFHDLYCDVYTAFDSLWTERDPKDVMAFPIIFSELKECFKHKYPQLAEKGHTYYYHN